MPDDAEPLVLPAAVLWDMDGAGTPLTYILGCDLH
jgi:hypothetical protein